MRNIWEVPLIYAILNTPLRSEIFIDREQDITQHAPLQGNMFYWINNKVISILK